MTGQPCARCGTDQPTDLTLCAACGRRLEATLRGVPDLLDLLDDATARLSRIDRPGSSRPDVDPDAALPLTAAVTPLPFDVPAAAAAQHLRTLTVLWADALADHLDQRVRIPHRLPARPPRGGRRAAEWLADRVRLLRHHPAAGDAAAELDHAVATGWALVDRPPETWWAGYCDTRLDDPDPRAPGVPAACGWVLRAALGAQTVTCPGCRTVHNVADRRDQLLDAAAHVLVTATEAARALASIDYTLPASQVRKWKFRGQLDQAGERREGVPLYRLGDIRALANRARYGQTTTGRAS